MAQDDQDGIKIAGVNLKHNHMCAFCHSQDAEYRPTDPEQQNQPECRLNHTFPVFQDPVVCVYDPACFDAGMILKILRVHPMVLIGGTLQANPLHLSPDEFLKERLSRSASQTSFN